MQTGNRTKPEAGILKAIKIVLASGAVAGTVGIWSALAGSAMSNSSTQLQSPGGNNLTTFPTLVPLVINPTSSQGVDQAGIIQRNVTAPEPGAVMQTPVIQTIIVGGSSGGGGAKPAARTRSSR